MNHKIVLFLTIATLLCGLLVSSQADVVLLDDFDGENLNTTVWRELAQNASGLDENVSGGKLVVEDINDPWVINREGGGTWALVTLFSQAFDPPLSDFNSEFQFSWSSDDPDTGVQSVQAMQGIYIAAYDTEAAQITRAGYHDSWVSYPGGKAGKIRGEDEINVAQHRLESSGSATINISRTGDEVVVSWDGEPLMSGTNDKPLQSIGILFYYYAYDGVGGPSFFGTESVDLVRVEDDVQTTVICQPGELECGETCCGEEEQCCDDTSCCYINYFTCCGGKCCNGGLCCDGVCCNSMEDFCCGDKCCSRREGYENCCDGQCSKDECPGDCSLERLYDESSEKVELLRKYRDEVLNTTLVGQEIIRLYYLWSPAIVKAMEADETFKREIKEMIDGILPLIREEVE